MNAPVEPETELAWARKAVRGDRAALEQLLLHHYEPLRAHLEQRLRDAKPGLLCADDLTQQTMEQVFRDIRKFEPRPGVSFAAWLRTIAQHRLLDELRARKRQKRGGEWQRRWGIETESGNLLNPVDEALASGNSPSRSVSRRELSQRLASVVGELDEDQREVVKLRFLDELSIDEIALIMERSTGSVRGLLHRGKAALRALLGNASQWLSSKG